MRSLVGVTLLVGVPLLGLLPLCFLNPKACALLCNVFVQSRQFHPKFVCLFFHVKFLTILASIVGYDDSPSQSQASKYCSSDSDSGSHSALAPMVALAAGFGSHLLTIGRGYSGIMVTWSDSEWPAAASCRFHSNFHCRIHIRSKLDSQWTV